MGYRLRVNQVYSTGRLPGSLPPGQADQHGDFDGGILVVDDEDKAAELVETTNNVEWAEEAPTDDGNPGVDAGDTYPQAEIGGETHYCGVNDCSREVDHPEDTCWQHSDE